MPSLDPVVSFENLLRPISDQFPCGQFPDDDELLDDGLLQNFLQRAEEQIKSGITQELANTLNETLRNLQSAMQKKSKEFSKLKFLMLTLMWRNQFLGLRDGVKLFEQMIDQFGSQLHPTDLLERLSSYRRNLPLLSASSSDSGYFAWLVLNRMKLDDSANFQVMHLLAEESTSDVDDWIRRCDDDYLRGFCEDFNELNERLHRLNQSFVTRVRQELEDEIERLQNMPSSDSSSSSGGEYSSDDGGASDFDGGDADSNSYSSSGSESSQPELDYEARQDRIQALKRIEVSGLRVFENTFLEKVATIKSLLEDRIRLLRPSALPGNDVGNSEASSGGNQNSGGGGSLSNRQGALAQLEKIAQYFIEHEMHSPIGYALREIHSWGNMRYPELLKRLSDNLVDSDDDMKKIARRLHFEWPEEED